MVKRGSGRAQASKLTVVIDTTQKYQSRLYFEDRLIGKIGGELEDIRLEWKGKRGAVVITVLDFNLVVEGDHCPEAHRYPEIQKRIGDMKALRELGLICNMLQASSMACDGCPYNPS